MMSKKNKLTPKQKAFCDDYAISGNAKQSYLKVYKCREKSAEASSIQLLGNPKVQAYLQVLKKKNQKKYDLSLDRIVGEREKLLEEATSEKDRQIIRDTLKEMGKLGGLYVEKKEVAVSGEMVISELDLID